MIAPPELVEDLLFARLDQELKPHKPAHVSEQQVQRDWNLLQQAGKATEASVGAGGLGGTE
jgi:hypothetical protein